MTSPYECPVCLDKFDFEKKERQGVSLDCGHSFCRGCLTQLHSKTCPTCRRQFSTIARKMAPNYALMAAMSVASTSSFKMGATIGAQATVIATRLKAMKKKLERKKAESLAAESAHTQARKLAQTAAKQVEETQSQYKRLQTVWHAFEKLHDASLSP